MVDCLMKKSQRNAKNRGRNVRKCPVQIGKEYEVDIVDATPNGLGIARINGFIVLVGNTKIGDHKTIMITETDALNAEAEIVT